MSVVLAIDTATPQVGVAVAGPDGPLAVVTLVEGRRHGEVLAPAVESVCAMAGVTLADVGLLAVDVGPGLFTGLRVGLSTAVALSHALGCPVSGFTSTSVLAAAHAGAARPVAAVVDIRRGEVAWALQREGAEVAAPEVAAPDDLAGVLADAGAGAGRPVLAVGDGARRYAALLTTRGVEVGGAATAHPSPAVLAELALTHPGRAGAATDLAPCYLRDADVRIGWEQAEAVTARAGHTHG